MSLFRFFGEQGAEHGGHLYWSEAIGGLPFRGSHAPLLTRDELEQQVEVQSDFHVESFDLNVPEQRERYQSIMTRVINGWYVLIHCDRSQPTTRIVEWAQRYGELSPAARQSAANRTIGYGPLPTVNLG